MIGFGRRLQWRRHKLFKLRAKPSDYEKRSFSKELVSMPACEASAAPHPNFAVRLIPVRRTINKQAID